MEDYQNRVIEEKTELDAKIGKLTAFVFSPKFGTVEVEEQKRMEQQLFIMMEYSKILKDRINFFTLVKEGRRTL